MTTWKPPHQTARQKAAAQTPTQRKLNRSAQLAPSIPLPATRCINVSTTGLCNDPELGHRDGAACIREGCDCPCYVRPT